MNNTRDDICRNGENGWDKIDNAMENTIQIKANDAYEDDIVANSLL